MIVPYIKCYSGNKIKKMRQAEHVARTEGDEWCVQGFGRKS
jgi:hypothetical protein